MKSIIFAIGLQFIFSAQAFTSVEELQKQLYKAEGFLHARPTLTHDILIRHLEHIGDLKTPEQLRWLQTLLRVSVTLNNLAEIENTAKRILVIPNLVEDTPKLITTLSSLGIMLRRQGYLNESVALFDCALALPITDHKQNISLKLSKGISYRNMGLVAESKTLYQSALLDAQKANSLHFEGAIHNALAMLALSNNKLVEAKRGFKKALQISQSTSRRSGQTVAGLNLMLISLLEKDLTLYNRLHRPISTLTLAAKNTDRHVYLRWLEAGFKVENSEKLTKLEKTALLQSLSTIKDINLYNLIVTRLSEKLGLNATSQKVLSKTYKGDLFQYLTMCG